MELFPSTDVALINAALEATSFEMDQAQQFLLQMTPQDAEKYFARSFLVFEKEPTLRRMLVSRQVQTGELFQDLFGKQAEDVSEVGSEKYIDEKSTWTKEDGVIQRQVVKLAQGPMVKAKGPMVRQERQVKWFYKL